MKEAGKKLKKILGILGIASVLFFVVTFIVYESGSSSGAVSGEMA